MSKLLIMLVPVIATVLLNNSVNCFAASEIESDDFNGKPPPHQIKKQQTNEKIQEINKMKIETVEKEAKSNNKKTSYSDKEAKKVH